MYCKGKWAKKTPWDSVYKFDAVVRRTPGQRTSAEVLGKLGWVFRSVNDVIENKLMRREAFTCRHLLGKGLSCIEEYSRRLPFQIDVQRGDVVRSPPQLSPASGASEIGV